MIISCPNCSTRFTISDAAIPADGRIVRCSKCGTKWHQDNPSAPQPPPPPLPEIETESEPEPDVSEPVAAPSGTESVAAKADTAVDDIEPEDEPESESPADEETVPSEPRLTDIDIGADEPSKPDALSNAPDLTAKRDEEEAPRPTVVKKKPPEPEPKVPVIALGWIVLAVLVVLVVGGTIVFRDSIVSGWPATERLYRSIGLSVKRAEPMPTQRSEPAETPPAPLSTQFKKEITSTTAENIDGVPYRIVNGTITNTGAATVPAPNVQVQLKDDAGMVLREVIQKPSVQTLAPGESTDITVRFENPPPETRTISFDTIAGN